MLDSIRNIINSLSPEAKDYFKYANTQAIPSLDVVENMDFNNEFNIRKTVNEVIDSNTLVPIDIKVDDRDFKAAPNFYTFATDQNFLGSTPYVSQVCIATSTFAEYCPKCSKPYLNEFKVDDSFTKFEEKVVLLQYGVCPRCKKTKNELQEYGLKIFQEMAVNCGQRSGKSALTAMMSAYLVHKLIKLQNPNSVYGLLTNSILYGTFVALTYAQAKDTLWEPLYGYLTNSKWFNEYHSMLVDYSHRYGEELVKLNDTFVVYRHRRIIVAPSGPDKRVLRGRTRCMACIPGNALISTARGLVRMDSVVVGDKVCIPHKADVSVHECTGKKLLWRLKLDSGQVLKATGEHGIFVIKDGKLSKKKMRDLTRNDVVAYIIGGAFPKRLPLFTPEKPKLPDERSKLITAMAKLKVFDYDTLIPAARTSLSRNVCTVTVSRLTRQGYLNKFYRKNLEPGAARCYYSISKSFNTEKLIKGRNKGKYDRDFIDLPTEMTPDLAMVLGYLIADGNNINTGKKGIIFTVENHARHLHYNACFERAFGIAPRTYYYDDGHSISGNPYYRSTITYARIVDFLRYCGIGSDYSADKDVPWTILQAPRACAIAFLQALYDCDGFASDVVVGYSSTSIKLVQNLQKLLLRLGYKSLIKRGKSYDSCSKYDTKITSIYNIKFDVFDSYKFSEEIGFSVKPCEVRSPRKEIRNKPWAILTDYNGVLGSQVTSVKLTREYAKVYDMTVDDKAHMYMADGVLAQNSVDELGWMDNSPESKKVKMNAGEVYTALERSLLTVRASANKLIRQGFHDVPTGYFLNISSPSSRRDKIMELVRKSVGSSKIYGISRPTWEMNPTILREDLSEEFRINPITAMRDYGAEPPLAANPFIESKELIRKGFRKIPNKVSIKHLRKKSVDDTYKRYATINTIVGCSYPTILGLDSGYSNNSFACTVARLHKDSIAIEAFVEIIPLPSMPLNYTMIYEGILCPLVEHFNVHVVTADRWNSLKLLSDLESTYGILQLQYSLKYQDFWDYKLRLEEHKILYPKPEMEIDQILEYDQDQYPRIFENRPVDHFVLQSLTVQDSGSSILKGDGGLTDDIFRATVLAATVIMKPDIQARLVGGSETGQTAVRQRALGAMIGYSKSSGKNVQNPKFFMKKLKG